MCFSYELILTNIGLGTNTECINATDPVFDRFCHPYWAEKNPHLISAIESESWCEYWVLGGVNEQSE